MVAAVVSVIALSWALQVIDGVAFPDSLIVSLLIVNLVLNLLALQKRANCENPAP